MPATARGWETLRESAAQIQRILDDYGNAFDFHDQSQPGWRLDPIPFVVDSTEWDKMGRGLVQRAKVLELVLDDLFGPQRLLAGGHLPTKAILTHREYLRECVGIASPGDHRLVLYAADVARSKSGTFTVLADRTQMPSGIGNAVQNREVMARVGPESLHESGVLPIADWLATCRSALGSLAPPEIDQPRIVMMTPGPSYRSHPEHAYLARTLGFTLVEPSDLTVREARVWLKSVSELEPVHVIMRLVRSDDCDPLELRAGSMVGVAGLVEACRRGNVAIANPLGSGVAQAAALLPFIPRLTRTLLGEEPLIDSSPTWWCGDPASMSHVLSNLDSLVIRSRERIDGRHASFGRLLSTDELDGFRRRIIAEPHHFVGQEEVEIDEQPSFDTPNVVERPTISRAFLVREDDGYRCMKGGLTLTADRAERITFSEHLTSKDTWVTAAEPVAALPPAPVPQLAPVDLRASITSRAAESMFWIGRNLERSHTAIRLVRAVSLMSETRHDLKVENVWRWSWTVDRVINAVVGHGWLPTPVPPPPSTAELLTDALVDRGRVRSLSTSLHFLLSNAASVRELFSADSWRLLSQISDLHVKLSCGERDTASELAYSTVTPLLALSSLVSDSMVRDPGWRFLDIGRRIEGATLVATTLGAALVDPTPAELAAPFHEAILNSWDGLVAYRRRYRSDIDPALLVDLLVTDISNPRSIRSQLTALSLDLEEVPGSADRQAEMLLTVRTLEALIDATTAEALVVTDANGRRPALAVLTDSVTATLSAVASEIELTYFAHIRATNLFAELVIEDDE